MQKIDSLTIDHPGEGKRYLELYRGDVTQMSEGCDFLALSAFPNDYTSSEGSLISALDKMGISVQQLASDPMVAKSKDVPCWISQPLKGKKFKQLVVFEPANPSQHAADMLRLLFESLQHYRQAKATTLVLPMLCTGYGQADLEHVFFRLFHGATLGQSSFDFPLTKVKLVAFTDSQLGVVKDLFKYFKDRYNQLYDLKFEHNREAEEQFEYYACKTKKWIDDNKNEIPKCLTLRQAFGVRLYTTNFFGVINSTLRDDSSSSKSFQEMAPIFDAISAGLRNLPNHPGITYRGMEPETDDTKKKIFNEWSRGNTVIKPDYTSSAAKINDNWYTYLPFKFDIQGKQGKSIKVFSRYPDEEEVLYNLNIRVQVTSREGNFQKCRFEATEIPTFFNDPVRMQIESTMSSEIPENRFLLKNISHLTDYLPRLEEALTSQTWNTAEESPNPIPELFQELLFNFDKFDFTLPGFNYNQWLSAQEKGFATNIEALSQADLETLQKLVTAHLRIERFAEGHLKNLFRKGYFVALLQRMEALSQGQS